MATVFNSPKDLAAAVGKQLGHSDWIEITQDRINKFADATGDHQWIHVDVERAKKGPFGAPIAHGYLTLSLYPLLRGLVDAGRPLFPGVTRVINYGLDKLRFPSNAVKAGSRVRAHCVLLKLEEALLFTILVMFSLKGQQIVTIPLDGPARELIGGTQQMCARLGSGEVLCWGRNDDGTLAVGEQMGSLFVEQALEGLELASVHVRNLTMRPITAESAL